MPSSFSIGFLKSDKLIHNSKFSPPLNNYQYQPVPSVLGLGSDIFSDKYKNIVYPISNFDKTSYGIAEFVLKNTESGVT